MILIFNLFILIMFIMLNQIKILIFKIFKTKNNYYIFLHYNVYNLIIDLKKIIKHIML